MIHTLEEVVAPMMVPVGQLHTILRIQALHHRPGIHHHLELQDLDMAYRLLHRLHIITVAISGKDLGIEIPIILTTGILRPTFRLVRRGIVHSHHPSAAETTRIMEIGVSTDSHADDSYLSHI